MYGSVNPIPAWMERTANPRGSASGAFFAALGSGIRLGGHIHHNDAAVWSPHRDEYASREIADTIVSPPDTTLGETLRR